MGRQKSAFGPTASATPGGERMAHLAHELNAPASLIAGSLENLEQCLGSIRCYIAATLGHRQSDPDLEKVYVQQDVESELAAASDLLAICREGVDRIGYLSDTFGVSARNRCVDEVRGSVDMTSVIRRAAIFARATCSSSAAIELDLEETPSLEADFESLSAAFINLIVNALDAVDGRSDPRVNVSLRYDVLHDAIEVRVRDNGSGIGTESMAHIFESFYTTKGHGSGLGLTIAREALERHGGSIEVVSGQNAGAEFIIRLPGGTRSGAGVFGVKDAPA